MPSIRCTDHKGYEYDSITEMCRHYGIDDRKYHKRRKAGYSVEAALTGKGIKPLNKPCQDHLGNSFGSIAEMCRHYEIDRKTLRDRIKLGDWDKGTALTARPRPQIPKDFRVGLRKQMRCGLEATVVLCVDSVHVVAEFEDGKRTVAQIGHFKEGTVSHPDLSTRGLCRYGCIEAKYLVTTADGQAWYRTRCLLCGRKDILSAQDIVSTARGVRRTHSESECPVRHVLNENI